MGDVYIAIRYEASHRYIIPHVNAGLCETAPFKVVLLVPSKQAFISRLTLNGQIEIRGDIPMALVLPCLQLYHTTVDS